jgi:hypothetical protein
MTCHSAFLRIRLKRANPKWEGLMTLNGKSWAWMSIAMAILCFTSARQAQADSILAVTVPTVTFTGNSACGPSQNAPCVEAFNAFFEWDNTTESVLPGTATITATGPLGTFSFFQSFFISPSGGPGGGELADAEWANSAGDALTAGMVFPITGFTPGTYPIVGPFQPGDGAAGLGCNPLDHACTSFFIGNSTSEFAPMPIVVSAVNPVPVPEPSSTLLFGTGLAAITGLGWRKLIR